MSNFFCKVLIPVCLINVLLPNTSGKGKVTFKTVVTTVYKNNPAIKAAKYMKFASDEGVAQAFSEYYPNVGIRLYNGFSRQNTNRRDHSSEELAKRYYSTGAITLSQNLFNGFGTKHKYNHAVQNVNSARYNYYQKEQEVFLESLKAFVDLWAAKAMLKNAIAMRDNLKDVLAARKLQLDSGEIKIQDYASVDAELHSAEARITGCKGEVESAYVVLKSFTGKDMEGECCLPDNVEKLLPNTLHDFREKALKNNMEILSARYAIEAARENLSLAKSGFAPRLDLNAQVARRWDHRIHSGRTYFGNYFENIRHNYENDTTYVGLSMNIPLWKNRGESISSYVRQASEMLTKTECEYLAVVSYIKQKCSKVWNDYVSSTDQLKYALDAEMSASIALDGYKQAELRGSESSTNVIYNENKLLDARNKYVEALAQKIKAMLDAEYYMGALNAEYFKLKSNTAEILENERKVRHAPINF